MNGLDDVRLLLALVKRRCRAEPTDAWAENFRVHVPPLIDEVDAARGALVQALGSDGAVPLGGLAAGIRKLAEQRDIAAGR